MNKTKLQSLLNTVKEIALNAGHAILAVAFHERDVSSKEDGSPVTRADYAAHSTIVQGLAEIIPRYPVISEEGDYESFLHNSEQFTEYWLVDPLDGTKEFLKENGEYTVNIALVDNGYPVLGVIFAPALDVMYYAASGLGSWKVKDNSSPERLTGHGSAHPVTALISRSHPSTETADYLRRFDVVLTIERGSSLKLCSVAEGEADIYPRMNNTCLWDTAAGAVIAREAGCSVVDIDGNDLMYDYRTCEINKRGLLQKSFIVYNPNTCKL